MKVQNTQDLSQFMADLKEWAQRHDYEQIISAIEQAQATSFTASELIIKYAETLKYLRSQRPDSMPTDFVDHWDEAIRVGLEAVETVHYPEKKLPFLTWGA